jgi:beta-galactosidase/beta-glucuronidase
MRAGVSLDGSWEVQLEPDAAWQPIQVPFPFEAPLSGIGKNAVHERIRYRRGFEAPWDACTLLRFGAVDWRAEVHLDGRRVGGHRGGYTGFALDLGRLSPGRHELVVEVEDPAEGPQPRGKQRDGGGIWYTRTTGIWQPVRLEAVPDDHVTTWQVLPDGTLRVDTARPTGVEVDAAPVERPWDPDDPALFPAEIRTAGGDRVTACAWRRTVEAHGGEILVNGRPRRIAGILDQQFWPGGIYAAPDEEAVRADVEAVKAMGFDLARMHVKVADARWYDWCDRLGVLVAQDIPSSHDLSTEAARAVFVRELDEIVAQLRNHPCVIAWVLFNEDWGEPPEEFQREVVRRVRALDPTRLVVDASGWKHRGDTDIHDVHDYGDDLSGHRGGGETPYWIGECGGVALDPEGFSYRTVDDLAAAYARLVGGIDESVSGFVWTQLTDVETELNGLLAHDRRPKADLARIREVNDAWRRSGR